MPRAGQTPHGARPNREEVHGFGREHVPARCVKPSGRSLEPRSNARPRGMAVQPRLAGADRIRLTGPAANILRPWYHSRVGDSATASIAVSSVPAPAVTATVPVRHSALARGTHWITTLCFF